MSSDPLHTSGPVRHHQDTVRQLHRLGDVVRDEQRRLTEFLLYLQNLITKEKPGLLVERGEGLVHQRSFGSNASVRAIATRWRMPPDSSRG